MRSYELFIYDPHGEPIGAAGCIDNKTDIPKYSPYLDKMITKANFKLKSGKYYCAVGLFDYLNQHEEELEKFLLRHKK